jgi:lipopolysaccharide export system permease protein
MINRFSFYICRNFLYSILTVLVICIILTYLIDLSELLKRTSNNSINFSIVTRLALYKLPNTSEQLFPIAILFGSMATLFKLSKNNEIIAAKASGMSIWQIVFPGLIVAFVMGLLTITLYNPISSKWSESYQMLDAETFKDGISIASSRHKRGLWVNQKNADGFAIIHAKKSIKKNIELIGVNAFQYNKENMLVLRIDSDTAILENGHWNMKNSRLIDNNLKQYHLDNYLLETYLSKQEVKENISLASTVSFWKLRKTIKQLEVSGISAIKYIVHLNFLIALPALFCSMVLIAATFSMQSFRMKNIMVMIISGIIIGFLLFIINFVSKMFGNAGILPPIIAAWWQIIITILISLSVLLKKEDG